MHRKGLEQYLAHCKCGLRVSCYCCRNKEYHESPMLSQVRKRAWGPKRSRQLLKLTSKLEQGSEQKLSFLSTILFPPHNTDFSEEWLPNFLNHKYILHCNLPMRTHTHTHAHTQDLCETVLWNSTFIHSVISYSIFWTTIITTRRKKPTKVRSQDIVSIRGIIASWRLLHLWGVTRIRTHERHLDAYWTEDRRGQTCLVNTK